MRIAIYTLFLLSLLSLVSATNSHLSEDDLQIGSYGLYQVDYCITQNGKPFDVEAVVSITCEDLNRVYGCQDDDRLNPEGFTVTPKERRTMDDGCVTLDIEAHGLSDNAYYYIVNGEIGGARIGTSEAGKVSMIPEFSIMASVAVLAGAMFIILRKR